MHSILVNSYKVKRYVYVDTINFAIKLFIIFVPEFLENLQGFGEDPDSKRIPSRFKKMHRVPVFSHYSNNKLFITHQYDIQICTPYCSTEHARLGCWG